MASESIDSLAPTDFPICVSFEDASGAISVAIERCQLCGSSKRNFYCKSCILRGEITPSRGKNSERYADKIQRWNAMKRSRSKLIYRCDEAMSRHVQFAQKKAEVTECNRRTLLIQAAIKEAKDKLAEEKKTLHELQQELAQKRRKVDIHQEKKSKIKRRMMKVEEYMTGQSAKRAVCETELGVVRRQHVMDLLRHIFPIEKVHPKIESNVMELSTVSALAEARHTAYIRGRWVYTDSSSGEVQFRVVDPTAPANGDYSPYQLWLQENKAALLGPDSDFCPRNPAYSISAALCYTGQLVSLLAYFLGVNLPYKLCYSEFCLGELEEARFNKVVYKLNHNVLHLCFTQAVPVENLQPKHTIHNVLMLVKTVELGRAGPFMVDSSLMQSLEMSRPLSYDVNDDSSDDDDGDAAAGGDTEDNPDVEWELAEAEDLPPADSYFVSTQSDSSLPSGLMASAAASVASFWKTYAGSTKDSPPGK